MEENKRKKVIVRLVNCIGIAGTCCAFIALLVIAHTNDITTLSLAACAVLIGVMLLGVFGLPSSSNLVKKMKREIVR